MVGATTTTPLVVPAPALSYSPRHGARATSCRRPPPGLRPHARRRPRTGVNGDDQLPGRVIAAAFLMAALCVLVPIAVVLAVFAGIALARRGRPHAGGAVVAVAALATAIGVSMRL